MSVFLDIVSINTSANLVADNYINYVNDLRGELYKIISSKNPSSSVVKNAFIAKGREFYHKRSKTMADELANETKGLVYKKIKHSPHIDKHVSGLNEATMLAINSISLKDVGFGVKTLKSLSFNALLNMKTSGIENAIKGAVVTSILSKNHYTGRGGKIWGTIISSHLIVRYHLISAFNEATLLSVDNEPLVVKTLNKANPYNGHVIRGFSDYSEIKDKAFHPRSNALIYKMSEE